MDSREDTLVTSRSVVISRTRLPTLRREATLKSVVISRTRPVTLRRTVTSKSVVISRTRPVTSRRRETSRTEVTLRTRPAISKATMKSTTLVAMVAMAAVAAVAFMVAVVAMVAAMAATMVSPREVSPSEVPVATVALVATVAMVATTVFPREDSPLAKSEATVASVAMAAMVATTVSPREVSLSAVPVDSVDSAKPMMAKMEPATLASAVSVVTASVTSVEESVVAALMPFVEESVADALVPSVADALVPSVVPETSDSVPAEVASVSADRLLQDRFQLSDLSHSRDPLFNSVLLDQALNSELLDLKLPSALAAQDSTTDPPVETSVSLAQESTTPSRDPTLTRSALNSPTDAHRSASPEARLQLSALRPDTPDPRSSKSTRDPTLTFIAHALRLKPLAPAPTSDLLAPRLTSLSLDLRPHTREFPQEHTLCPRDLTATVATLIRANGENKVAR